MQVDIVSSDVAQIVASVFDNMLDLEVIPCDLIHGEGAWRAGAERMTAQVRLSGAWNGSVALECDRRQAREFARRYLTSSGPSACGPAPDIGDEVATDLVGELANMIGGNWKCVLGRGLHLSAPEVAAGSLPELNLGPASVIQQLSFRSAAGIFWVTILEA